jgi:hypothetical protein
MPPGHLADRPRAIIDASPDLGRQLELPARGEKHGAAVPGDVSDQRADSQSQRRTRTGVPAGAVRAAIDHDPRQEQGDRYRKGQLREGTTFVRPFDRATSAMISSGALPKLALRKPPTSAPYVVRCLLGRLPAAQTRSSTTTTGPSASRATRSRRTTKSARLAGGPCAVALSGSSHRSHARTKASAAPPAAPRTPASN